MAPCPLSSQPNTPLTHARRNPNVIPPKAALSLLARQAQAPATVTVTAIPVTPPPRAPNNDTASSTLGGGAIAGIVIGSVVGLLLLLWIVRSCLNLGAAQKREGMYPHVKPERHHRHRSRHVSRPRRYSYAASKLSVPPAVFVPEGRTRRTRTRHRRMAYGGDGRGGPRYRRDV
ncbi:hypothetical protein E4U21_004126 [Claviceps maximensis]|nr:hypothetical protein E4U21_004126 [Claviceps maximensis]